MPGNPQEVAAERGALELIINGVYLTNDFSFWTSSRLRQNKFTHIIFVDRREQLTNTDYLDPNEFECLELNFNAALVLPNLYKSDKFLAKALENEGKVLILEPSTSPQVETSHNTTTYQKGIAIILGYLMYHFELGFWDAYEALRKIYRTKFELDRFLIIQLYEYEPILEVHRAAEEMGHSRSGERLRSVLKRASCVLDTSYEESATANNNNTSLDDDYYARSYPEVEADANLLQSNRSSRSLSQVAVIGDNVETMVE